MKFLFTLLSAGLLVVGIYWFASPQLPSFFYQTLALLLLGTGAIYFYLIDIKKEKPEYFVQLYMATLFVKILAYGAYVFFVVWDDKAQAGDNALFFMVTYFLFTAVEVTFLYRKVSR